MHAVIYGLIDSLIKHLKRPSQIHLSTFQVSHFGSSLQAGQCMQQQHHLMAATKTEHQLTTKPHFLLCVLCFVEFAELTNGIRHDPKCENRWSFFSTRFFAMNLMRY